MIELALGGNAAIPTARLEVYIDSGGTADSAGIAVMAALVDASGRVSGADHLVHDGSTPINNAPVEISRREDGSAVVSIDTDALPETVDRVALLAHRPTRPQESIGAVRVCVAERVGAGDIFCFAIPGGNETALILGEVYRRAGACKFRAIGQGYAQGISGAAQDFGFTVPHMPESASRRSAPSTAQQAPDAERQAEARTAPSTAREPRRQPVTRAEPVVMSRAGRAHLIGKATSQVAEVARQRATLRQKWASGSATISRIQAQMRATSATADRRSTELQEVMRNFGVAPDANADHVVPQSAVSAWLETAGPNAWRVKSSHEHDFDLDISAARSNLITSRQKTFGGSARRQGAIALGRYAARLNRLEELESKLESELKEAVAARAADASAARSNADAALKPAEAFAVEALRRLPAPLQPWSAPAWQSWPSQPELPGFGPVYAGDLTPLEDTDLGDNASFGVSTAIPYFLTLERNLRVVYDNASRGDALALARSVLLRNLAAAPPGDLQLCIFDPIGLGQSASQLLDMAEYDADLIGGKVWSSSADLGARLADQTSHVELVIQKYLRSTYASIDEFNEAAGEIAEPYRLLVVFDFPSAFTEETFGRLKSVLQNGPRCGVFTALLHNSSVAAPYGVDIEQISPDARRMNFGATFVEDLRGYSLQMRLRPDIDSPPLAASIVETVGRRSSNRGGSAIGFSKVLNLYRDVVRRGTRGLSAAAAATAPDDPDSWWADDSTAGVCAPIGQKGARDAAILAFDSSDHAGALLVGRPGSGKSTLLHTYIAGLTTLYGPDELELYLIDFKEGVEFKSYAAEALPHARVVAIESDREFGLSVLQSLQAELSRRGELLRGTGGKHAGLQALRTSTREPLPRILLVFDEFQVLFARNDKVGLAAADLLETIIRQGRGFGMHVLLGSQSLSGLDALGAHVPQLLPTRILLPATELDARRVLGDNNDAGQYLTSHGEGILNQAGGAVEANERFKGALLDEHERIDRLRLLRRKANSLGMTRRPMVFEGNALAALDASDPRDFREETASSGRSPIRLRTGAPMTIGGVADVELRREAGANLLAVIRDSDTASVGVGPSGSAYGTLVAGVASAAQSEADIDIIDFMSVDDGLDDVLEPLLEAGRITLRRRRGFASLCRQLADQVRSRVDADDTNGRPRLCFLFGVHRARELDSDIGSLDADAELSETVETIMRDGPEVGVHLWIWADTVGGASRRLTPRMMRECSWRLAGKMSGDDSLTLLGSERAAELRDRQIAVTNDDLGVLTRAITFAVPSKQWLADIVDGAAAAHGR